MRRSPTNAVSTEDRNAPTTTISGPVLPALRKRRSPEQAACIATKRRLLEFIQMLETRRAELGISRSAIARELGVTQPTISRLFSGHVQNIELRTMARVAEVLDSDLELAIRPRVGSAGTARAEPNINDHIEVSGVSKYDPFWKTVISRPAFHDALERAAHGAIGEIDVAGLVELSTRKQSWSGTVRVCRDSIVPVDHTLMVHAKSVGNVLAASGMLVEWPETTFRLSINKPGTRLTVRKD